MTYIDPHRGNGRYINPHQSDADYINNHPVLRRRQARADYLAAMAEDGFDAAIQRSKRSPRPRIQNGFKRIPGASRSGALDPQTRTRMENQERDGLIELQRDPHGAMVAYRLIGDRR